MAGMIIFMVVLFLFFALLVFWWIKQSKPPNYNGYLWLMGGGIEKINRQPEGQKPFLFNYRWYDLLPRYRPLYMWKQDQVKKEEAPGVEFTETIITHWEPGKPADYRLIDSEQGQDKIAQKDYITPNELYQITDLQTSWSTYFTPDRKLTEAVKLGISVAMVAICIIGIVMMMDMLGKDDDKPVVTNSPEKITTIIKEKGNCLDQMTLES